MAAKITRIRFINLFIISLYIAFRSFSYNAKFFVVLGKMLIRRRVTGFYVPHFSLTQIRDGGAYVLFVTVLPSPPPKEVYQFLFQYVNSLVI